jgi:hypothetical protein
MWSFARRANLVCAIAFLGWTLFASWLDDTALTWTGAVICLMFCGLAQFCSDMEEKDANERGTTSRRSEDES